MIPAIPVATRAALGVAARGKKAATATRRAIRSKPIQAASTAAFAGYSVGEVKGQKQAKHPYPRGY